MGKKTGSHNVKKTGSSLLPVGQSIGYTNKEAVENYKKYKDDFLSTLQELSDTELIDVYNSTSGRFFNAILQIQYNSIISELERRDIDFSAICNDIPPGSPGFAVSFNKTVRLEGKKMMIVSDI